jgi:hypothetical protein
MAVATKQGLCERRAPARIAGAGTVGGAPRRGLQIELPRADVVALHSAPVKVGLV